MGSENEVGCPLQLVQLNMNENKVEVNEAALQVLVSKLKVVSQQTEKIAIVSVMGAFRTGKSFLLDLFLRHLRYEDANEEAAPRPSVPPRGGDEDYPTPPWITAGKDTIEGSGDGGEGGFRFRGGMDHCTEGIWVWSEPFVRMVNGKKVALLLMDTQGAWGGEMSKEQSATIFGLTAVLSSKQIYNINMQIQTDKVENLAYFMHFAQDAIRKGAKDGDLDNKKPFQSLDFLVRDWANFEDEWTMEECRKQMQEHLARFVDPKVVVDGSTAQAMQGMFDRINCYCMPHPGLKIQKATWSGAFKDISPDFIRFIDEYVHEVFTTGLDVKKLMGVELSTTTFPFILRDFVSSFQDACPVAMSFTEAMSNATVLMTKEKLLKKYTKDFDKSTKSHPRGIEPKEFEKLHKTLSSEIEAEFQKATILGADATRNDAWKEILEQLNTLYEKYMAENNRRLEMALVGFANLALLAGVLLILDWISDWTCDAWVQTCRDLSSLMKMIYFSAFLYIGFFVWRLNSERGKIATMNAGAEMWKECVRLGGVYWENIQHVKGSDIKELAQNAIEYGKSLVDKKEKKE